jgi:glutaminyl-peptide cyclotransferase
MKTRAFILLVFAIMLTVRRPGFAAWQTAPSLPLFGYTVVHTYPHDRDAFTQGLQVVDGVFYEGTGLNGRSSIRVVKIDTGEVIRKRDVPAEYFGEGITVRGSELFQLTWQSGVALVYDKQTFAPKRQHKYTGEGWGLTQDKTSLIMSDGSEFLRFIDPATFAERRRIRVTAGGTALKDLNELEYVKGEIFANVWRTDYVARIDPATGAVNGYIDFRGLLTSREREATDVLNGIAYDEGTDRLFITGKLWPRVYEVRVVRK